MKRFLSIMTVGLILGGCAGNSPRTTPLPSEPGHSEAWNITKAAGFFKLDDAELPENVEDPNSLELLDNPLSNAVYLGLAFQGPMGGMNPYGDLALRSLELLTRSSAPSANPRMFAWMPADLAVNEPEARKKIAEIMDEAVRKTLVARGNTVTPDPSRVREDVGRYFTYQWNGPDCGMPTDCLQNIQSWTPVKEAAPEVVGGYTAYTFGYDHLWAYPGVRSRVEKNDDGQRWTMNLEYLVELSQNLPRWLYFYLPPESAIHAPGQYDGLKVPLLLSGGQLRFFVASKED